MLSGDVVRYDKLQGECCLPGFQRDAFRVADVLAQNAGFIVGTDGLVAVSYTHLDVYKRQAGAYICYTQIVKNKPCCICCLCFITRDTEHS